MYPLIRILHVVLGALWFGIAVFNAWFLVPLAMDLGPDAAKISGGLQRRGFIVVMPVIAGLTILSGVWLYWRFTGGFDPAQSATHPAMAYGAGGALGLIALVIGAAVISRATRRSTTLTAEAANAKEPERAGLLQQAAGQRARAKAAGEVIAALLLLTMILMAGALFT